jgi:hypothetical protein
MRQKTLSRLSCDAIPFDFPREVDWDGPYNRINYRFLNCAGRFSTKAAIPSF